MKRKLEEQIEEKLPKSEREKIEIQERKQRKIDIIDTKKSLWKLRNKENKHVQKTNKTIRLENMRKMEDKMKMTKEILTEIREEKKSFAEEQQTKMKEKSRIEISKRKRKERAAQETGNPESALGDA